jgi:hypothetical protein
MRKLKEWTLIQLTARNNNFRQKLLQKLNRQIQHKKAGKKMKETKTKHGHLHILQPKNKKNHQLIQNILQEHQHPTTHKAKNGQQYTRTGQERDL